MPKLPSPVKKTRPKAAGLSQLASKYFPGLEDKVLYVIQGESGGDPEAVGDGGSAYGLFQSHYISPGTSIEDQFKDARRLYDARVKAGGSGFEDWGENNLYEGKKFGALGNNPYPGGASVTDPKTPKKPYGPATSAGIFGGPSQGSGTYGMPGYRTTKTLPSPVASKPSVTPPKPAASYTPTGKYDDDMNGYNAAAEAAWGQLDAISDRIIQIDEKSRVAKAFKGYVGTDGQIYSDPSEMPEDVGVEIGSDGQPQEIWVTDPEATRILQEALKWDDQIQRLESRRKAGLTKSGDDAAKAYLESEQTKAAEADRKYGNFVTRIKDLQAIEDIPTARAMSLATALNAASTANAKRTSQFDPLATVNQGSQTDFSADAVGLRNTMGSAPEYYGPAVGQFTNMQDTTTINGKPLFPVPDGSIQIPGVPFSPEAPGDFDIPNPFPGKPSTGHSGFSSVEYTSRAREPVAPTAQTFDNPFSDLARRAGSSIRSLMR